MKRGRKGTDHAVFGGVRGAGRAGGGAQPRPLHRLVRLVLPHLVSLAAEPRLESEGEEPRRGVEIPFSLPLWSLVRWHAPPDDGDKATEERRTGRSIFFLGRWLI